MICLNMLRDVEWRNESKHKSISISWYLPASKCIYSHVINVSHYFSSVRPSGTYHTEPYIARLCHIIMEIIGMPVPIKCPQTFVLLFSKKCKDTLFICKAICSLDISEVWFDISQLWWELVKFSTPNRISIIANTFSWTKWLIRNEWLILKIHVLGLIFPSY